MCLRIKPKKLDFPTVSSDEDASYFEDLAEEEVLPPSLPAGASTPVAANQTSLTNKPSVLRLSTSQPEFTSEANDEMLNIQPGMYHMLVQIIFQCSTVVWVVKEFQESFNITVGVKLYYFRCSYLKFLPTTCMLVEDFELTKA